jgi:hypothetical protein
MKIKKLVLGILLVIASCTTAAFGQFSPNQQDLQISSDEKTQLIDTILKAVKTSYVFPEISLEIETAILKNQRKGGYNKIRSSKEFADTITNQLALISNDKHLHVLFSHDTVQQKTDKEPPLPDFIKTFAVQNNFGFNKLDILDGNIGYMNILGFFPLDEATNKAIASLDYLSNTQALIIDLRENTGGVGALANFVLSYFFDQRPVNLLEVVFRKDNRVEQSWTSFYIPGKRYTGKSVYVLTSSETFSAGEAFAYILQSYKKATIIGEQTGGGANVGDLIRLNDHFVMNLPIGRPVSPITKTNWEGVGVKPDIEISKEKALAIAHITALEKLIETCTDKKLKEQLKVALARIQPILK